MSEIPSILAAFDTLSAEGKGAALATVIRVDGSAYRRPGARLLIAADGRTWGSISGGCLEKDVSRRGRQIIGMSNCVRCEYDPRDDDDFSPRSATGCGGTVEIFIQPLSSGHPGPMRFFRQSLDERRTITMATVLSAASAEAKQAGECFIADVSTPPWLDLFVEQIVPPQSLILFGNGPEAAPLRNIAAILGWSVQSVDGRAASDSVESIAIRPDDAVVLMTHNVHDDARILAQLPAELRYLGILGPRHRTRRLLAALADERDCFAPVGLDIGAETPQEIALAIISEIQAVMSGRSGSSLRDQPGPIHHPISMPSPFDHSSAALQPCPT